MKSWKLHLSILSLTFTCSAFALTNLGPELNSPWILKGQTQILDQDVQKIVDLIREDDEVREIARAIVKRFRLNSPEEIRNHFQVSNDLGAATAGEFRPTSAVRTREFISTEPNRPWALEVEREIAKAIESKRFHSKHLDKVIYTIVADQMTRIRQTGTLLETYDTVVHEMVHMAYFSNLDTPDVLTVTDFDDYALKRISQPGSETTAYRLAGRACIRLKNRYPEFTEHSRCSLEQFFNDEGNFDTTREADFAHIILFDLGYRNEQGFAEIVVGRYNDLVQDYNMLVEVQSVESQNVKLFSDAITQLNRTKLISSLLNKTRFDKQMTEAQTELKFRQNKVKSVEKEMAETKTKMDQLHTKYASYFAN